ncbi:MAG: stage III sporulation protein AF [Lachnospiraceae bacterium]|nr:stage III sporulation protein AF [Lachnospiraceae bacterium]
MDSYVNIMKEASIFMIVAEMLIQLIPSAEYGKYIRFLMDLICIMILFLPIVNMLRENVAADYAEEIRMEEEGLEKEISLWGDRIYLLLVDNFSETGEGETD